MPDWPSFILAAIGVIFPTGTFIVLAVKYGRTVQKVDGLEEGVQEIKAHIAPCQKELRDRDNELHSRVTEIAKIQAAHVERTDGITDRVVRIEKKVFNGTAHA